MASPPSHRASTCRDPVPGVCGQIGADLMDIREHRRLSLEEMARRLLVSKSQLIGLEHGDASAFYNTAYFLKALRKYMEFGGIHADGLEEAPAEEWNGLRMTLDDGAPRQPTVSVAWSRAFVSAAIVAAIAAAGGVAYQAFQSPPTAVEGDRPPPLPASPPVPLEQDSWPAALVTPRPAPTHP